MKRRPTVNSIITKGFTHFKRLAGIEDSKCFKELGTTNITRLQDKYCELNLTSTVSDYSNKKVIGKHYLAQINNVKKCSNFRISPEAIGCVN